MAATTITSAIADQYFTYESRLASFQTAHPLPKRRGSNANSKAPKSIKWPHKFLAGEELAKAGFFFHPLPSNPDNVACFLCHRSLDGWEEDDDPFSEHLRLSPDCGWAIVAAIEKQGSELAEEYPSSTRMTDARKATFADQWPHEGKKGWKCKVKQMVAAGWKYTPTPEFDDMATCVYCALALDGWEPSDSPSDEHFKRSPDCPFFTINDPIQLEKPKQTKRGRPSKASRLSTQSILTVNSEAPSISELAEEDDSILTTATNATTTSKKMAHGKKAAGSKSKKSRAKKGEPVEVALDEPEAEVVVESIPKPSRGRKRKSDAEPEEITIVEEPPTKRRATRTRASTAVDDSIISHAEDDIHEAPKKGVKKGGKKGRASTRSSRNLSTASVASLRGALPDDDEIDRALEADLERPLTEDEAEAPPMIQPKKRTKANRAEKEPYSMFETEPLKIDDAVIEAELNAMEVDLKSLPKPKGAKGKQPRKVSAKQQAAARRAAEKAEAAEAAAAQELEAAQEAEREAQRLAEQEAEKEAQREASQQAAAELEQSNLTEQSPPVPKGKRQRATSRQPTQKAKGRALRGSVMTDTSMLDNHDNNDESGQETDASNTSQSTVVRQSTRGGRVKKPKGKKVVPQNIEDIVRPAVSQPKPIQSIEQDEPTPVASSKKVMQEEDISMAEERYFTPVPDIQETIPESLPKSKSSPEPVLARLLPQATKKAAKPKGRPAKAALAPLSSVSPEPDHSEMDYAVPEDPFLEPAKTPAKVKSPLPPLSPLPPAKEATPSASPQSSDAENHPPSSKPSLVMSTIKKATTTPRSTKRVPLAASTPSMSPSKRNVIAGLQSSHPWTAVDLDAVFLQSPSGDSLIKSAADLFGSAVDNAKNGELTSPEKKMTVEEWIKYNATQAEEKLRNECERMVGAFEREGTRAMAALEGIECLES